MDLAPQVPPPEVEMVEQRRWHADTVVDRHHAISHRFTDRRPWESDVGRHDGHCTPDLRSCEGTRYNAFRGSPGHDLFEGAHPMGHNWVTRALDLYLPSGIGEMRRVRSF